MDNVINAQKARELANSVNQPKLADSSFPELLQEIQNASELGYFQMEVPWSIGLKAANFLASLGFVVKNPNRENGVCLVSWSDPSIDYEQDPGVYKIA